MTDKNQVGFYVESERKQKWENYADETGRTLSGMIRCAVEAFIHEDRKRSDEAGLSTDAEEKFQELLEGTDNNQDLLQEIYEEVHVIRQEVKENPELQELMNEVFSLLPVGESTVIESKYSTSQSPPPEFGESQTVKSGKVDDLAEILDSSEFEVERALEQIQEQTYLVQTTDVDGETRYYKEE